MTLHVQFATMIIMIVSGIYLGVIRDTYLRFFRYWQKNTVLTYLFEISFWLLQTFILYYILFLTNAGELRFYIFLACLLGFSMYKALFATFYKKLLERLIHIVTSIAIFIGKVIYYILVIPIKYLLQFIAAVVLFFVHALVTIITFSLKIIFTPVIWLGKLLYGLLPQKVQKYLYKIAGLYSKIENVYIRIKNFFARRK
ncbi:spore cortex biosynthesis protein YabQ [Virgibacillus soli]|uniref:Spore cortex biosynthesis protein YabQ n=1 Tax=Paracerasibacillus soli TaxID=480284 RepID=A0ABU5CUF7_9BACI|nr:spore cortex biosynthesis protein YabQ [Virgibacillus soli]MDY0410010.1 spore cortex biosynthesis protein YabQ [Virgibacillus soli]